MRIRALTGFAPSPWKTKTRSLVSVSPMASREIILSTADGQSIRFKEEQVRPTGRGTYGVVGMRLDDGDLVVSMEILSLGCDDTHRGRERLR